MRNLLLRLAFIRRWLPVIVTLVVPFAVGILTEEKRYLWAGLVTLAGAGLQAYLTRPEPYDRDALERVLTALPTNLEMPEDARVHCAVYVPVGSGEKLRLRSVTDYMPDGEELAGYTLNRSEGIVGLAFRSRKTCVEFLDDPKFNDAGVFEDHMITRWGFDRPKAQKLPKERRAYLAAPVQTQGNIVLGVVFMESVRADVFRDDETLPQRVEALAPFFHELLLRKGS